MQQCKDCKTQCNDLEEFCENCKLFLPGVKTYDRLGVWLVRTLAIVSGAFCLFGWGFNSYLNANIPTNALWFFAGVFASITLEFCYSLKSGVTFRQVLDTIATGSSHSLLEVKRTARGVERQLELTHEKTEELGRQLQRLDNPHNIDTLSCLIEQNEELLDRLREVGEIYNLYIKPRLNTTSPVYQPSQIMLPPAENKSLLQSLAPLIDIAAIAGSTIYTKKRFDSLEQRLSEFTESKLSRSGPAITPPQMASILKRFNDLDSIKRASVDNVASAGGVSKKLAAQLKKHLDNQESV